MSLMFEKPKKKKKKSKHYQNPRITDIIECDMCHNANATDNHELKGGVSFRNSSCEAKFQLKLCSPCHRKWEQVLTKKEKNVIRAYKQRSLMELNNWTIEDFREHVGISYL